MVVQRGTLPTMATSRPVASERLSLVEHLVRDQVLGPKVLAATLLDSARGFAEVVEVW